MTRYAAGSGSRNYAPVEASSDQLRAEVGWKFQCSWLQSIDRNFPWKGRPWPHMEIAPCATLSGPTGVHRDFYTSPEIFELEMERILRTGLADRGP